MFVNLLAKIEAEINQVANQINSSPVISHEEFLQLMQKREKLHVLAKEYISLEGQYKEIAGLNSIY